MEVESRHYRDVRSQPGQPWGEAIILTAAGVEFEVLQQTAVFVFRFAPAAQETWSALQTFPRPRVNESKGYAAKIATINTSW